MTWWRRHKWGVEWWHVQPRWLILLALTGWAAIGYRRDPEYAASEGGGRLACFLWAALAIVIVGTVLEAFTTRKK